MCKCVNVCERVLADDVQVVQVRVEGVHKQSQEAVGVAQAVAWVPDELAGLADGFLELRVLLVARHGLEQGQGLGRGSKRHTTLIP